MFDTSHRFCQDYVQIEPHFRVIDNYWLFISVIYYKIIVGKAFNKYPILIDQLLVIFLDKMASTLTVLLDCGVKCLKPFRFGGFPTFSDK